MGGMAKVMGVVKVAASAMWAGIGGPIGLVVAAIVGLGLVVWKFRDKIWNFIKGTWNKLLDKMESFLPIAAPIAEMIGIELPDNLDHLKGSVKKAGDEIEIVSKEHLPDFSDSLEEAEKQLAQAEKGIAAAEKAQVACLLYTSPSPRD